MVWWRNVVARRSHRVGPGGRDYLGAIALVVWRGNGGHQVGRRGVVHVQQGVGSWGTLVGVGFESTDDLRNDFSWGIEEVVNGGDVGAPGPKDGMVVEMLLVLGFGYAKGPEGAGRGE